MRTLARSCTKCDTAEVVKVAFIGADSVEFTRNVVTNLCSCPELTGDLDLALHDVSAERFAHAQALAARIVAQTGSGATVTASADRRPVLGGARYVINEIQVGGYDATRLDFDIPARYGVRGAAPARPGPLSPGQAHPPPRLPSATGTRPAPARP
jgi:alpha-galactosidase/6-phospho-beta-glucosidase family protein